MSAKSTGSGPSSRAGLRSQTAGEKPADQDGTRPSKSKGFSPDRVADIRSIVEEMITPLMENISDLQSALTDIRIRMDTVETDVQSLKASDARRVSETNLVNDLTRDVVRIRGDVNRLLESQPEGLDSAVARMGKRLMDLENHLIPAPVGAVLPENQAEQPVEARQQPQGEHNHAYYEAETRREHRPD